MVQWLEILQRTFVVVKAAICGAHLIPCLWHFSAFNIEDSHIRQRTEGHLCKVVEGEALCVPAPIQHYWKRASGHQARADPDQSGALGRILAGVFCIAANPTTDYCIYSLTQKPSSWDFLYFKEEEEGKKSRNKNLGFTEVGFVY